MTTIVEPNSLTPPQHIDRLPVVRALDQYPSAVFTRDGRMKRVKNLGWLLRHWQEISHFTIRTIIGAGQPNAFRLDGALLVAWGKPNASFESYSTGFAGDAESVRSWLGRPVFSGVPLVIDPHPGLDASKRSSAEMD